MVSFVHPLALDESRIIRLINPPPSIFHHCQRSSMSGDDIDDTTSGNEMGILPTEHKVSVWILEIVERTQLLPDRCKDGPKNCQIPPSRAPGASALRAKRHSPAESKALILANSNHETMRPNAWNGFLRFKPWTCNVTVQNAKVLVFRDSSRPKIRNSSHLQSFQSRCIVPLETTSGCSPRVTDLSKASKTSVRNFWSSHSEFGERFEFGFLKAIRNPRDAETSAMSGYEMTWFLGFPAGQKGVQNLEV